MDNKRKTSRVIARLEGTVSKDKRLILYAARIKDVSETGICVQLKQYFEVGALLEIEVRSDEFRVPLKGTTRVMWIRHRDSQRFPYEAGLQFVEILPADRAKLCGYVLHSLQRGGKDIPWLD